MNDLWGFIHAPIHRTWDHCKEHGFPQEKNPPKPWEKKCYIFDNKIQCAYGQSMVWLGSIVRLLLIRAIITIGILRAGIGRRLLLRPFRGRGSLVQRRSSRHHTGAHYHRFPGLLPRGLSLPGRRGRRFPAHHRRLHRSRRCRGFRYRRRFRFGLTAHQNLACQMGRFIRRSLVEFGYQAPGQGTIVFPAPSCCRLSE